MSSYLKLSKVTLLFALLYHNLKIAYSNGAVPVAPQGWETTVRTRIIESRAGTSEIPSLG